MALQFLYEPFRLFHSISNIKVFIKFHMMIISHRAKRKQKFFLAPPSHLLTNDTILVVSLVKCAVKASAVQKMPHIILVQIHHTYIILIVLVILIITASVTHTHHVTPFLRCSQRMTHESRQHAKIHSLCRFVCHTTRKD